MAMAAPPSKPHLGDDVDADADADAADNDDETEAFVGLVGSSPSNKKLGRGGGGGGLHVGLPLPLALSSLDISSSSCCVAATTTSTTWKRAAKLLIGIPVMILAAYAYAIRWNALVVPLRCDIDDYYYDYDGASSSSSSSVVVPPGSGSSSALWMPGPNPYVDAFNTTGWMDFVRSLQEARANNSANIDEWYGSYCPDEPGVPMCPEINGDGYDGGGGAAVEPDDEVPPPETLTEEGDGDGDGDDENDENDDGEGGDDDGRALMEFDEVVPLLENAPLDFWERGGPTVECMETGSMSERCGVGNPWLNKTIWRLYRGKFCAAQNAERREKYPMPPELSPYFELGYDRADPTKSTDGEPFDGGGAPGREGGLPFDADTARDHFHAFEAMLEHYYEGHGRSILERQISPSPDDPHLYAPMIKRYADQIARAVLRARDGGDDKLVIGVLGDSVTAGDINCYYDVWPEQLRRQIAPLFAALGLTVEVRNAAETGGSRDGWNLAASQLLCAHDTLGASDRDGVGLDFIFVCNTVGHAKALDAEHMIRRALLGESHTIISITVQEGMNKDEMLKKYAPAGLTVGTPFGELLPELGVGQKYWYPDLKRAFYGMPGDGFCHLTTRAGSSAVVFRNWHWGPLLHQIYADAYALLLSRAARQAIDELSVGKMPPKPQKAGCVDHLLDEQWDMHPEEIEEEMLEEMEEEKEEKLPTWRHFLYSDMGSENAMRGGIGGVRCAVGPTNQPGSTLLPHWLRPAEGSPFEEMMIARGGTSFVPQGHDTVGSDFYKVTSSNLGGRAVEVGEWVSDPEGFGAEAPRTEEQCMHVDGSTTVNMPEPEGVSWLVWEVPVGAVSIGRAMVCHPMGSKEWMAEDAFEKGDIRFHYAVPERRGGWRVLEDVHKSKPVEFIREECIPVVREMNKADLKAARDGGMWVAVEWTQEGIFDFSYLVAM